MGIKSNNYGMVFLKMDNDSFDNSLIVDFNSSTTHLSYHDEGRYHQPYF